MLLRVCGQGILPQSHDNSADRSVSQKDDKSQVDVKKVCCGFFHKPEHVKLDYSPQFSVLSYVMCYANIKDLIYNKINITS